MRWPEDARTALETHRVGRLATADGQARPHCVPVCFFFDGEAIFIALDDKPKQVDDVRRLRRVRNIVENPQVCLLLDHYSDDWTELAFVQVSGEAHLVEPSDHAVAGLRNRYPPYRTMPIDSRPMIRIEPSHVVAWKGDPTLHA